MYIIDQIMEWLSLSSRWIQWAFLASAIALPLALILWAWSWAAVCDLPGSC